MKKILNLIHKFNSKYPSARVDLYTDYDFVRVDLISCGHDEYPILEVTIESDGHAEFKKCDGAAIPDVNIFIDYFEVVGVVTRSVTGRKKEATK